MKAGSIVLWSCSLLMEAFLDLSLLRWTSAMRGPGGYCKRVSAVEDLDQEGWDRVK